MVPGSATLYFIKHCLYTNCNERVGRMGFAVNGLCNLGTVLEELPDLNPHPASPRRGEGPKEKLFMDGSLIGGIPFWGGLTSIHHRQTQ
jgi:hypothetical protein